MPDSRINKPGGKPPDALEKALIAFREKEEPSLYRDTKLCLSLPRLRDLATDASLTTAADTEHLLGCRRCTVRLQTMQAKLETDPQANLKVALTTHQTIPHGKTYDVAYAEKSARELFDRMCGHGAEPERAHHLMWHAHDLAQALRHCHYTGSHEDCESFGVMMFAAIGAAVHDAGTHWAQSFDRARPVAVMIGVAAAETARYGHGSSALLAEAHADLIHGAPVLLKVSLVFGLAKLLRHDELLAVSIATHLAERDDHDAHCLLSMLAQTETPAFLPLIRGRRWSDINAGVQSHLSLAVESLRMLDAALVPPAPRDSIVATVQKSVLDAAETMFTNKDAVPAMLQLLSLRYYVGNAVERIRAVLREATGYVFEDVISLLMKRARREHGRLFLGMDVVAKAGAMPTVMQVMAELLERRDTTLRQALFLNFVELLQHTVKSQPGANPRFAGEGADWVFKGGAQHPLNIFGSRAALLAKRDPEIARLIEWSNHRLESETPVGLPIVEEPA